MFGTLGFSELIIILAIVLIIFGAGRLPQIGEGVGKALKGFKKEVREEPPPVDPNAGPQPAAPPAIPPVEDAQVVGQTAGQPQGASAGSPSKPTAPYRPGPEATPGTTAAILAAGTGPQPYQPPRPKTAQPAPATASAAQPAGQASHAMTMEERMTQPPPTPRAAYPALPPTAQAKPGAKRPSAIVNKQAVARVQAQQAALKEKAAQSAAPSSQDMQSLGESVGDALRTFRQAVADVRSSVDPEMRTIQAEMEAAEKELQQSIEAARHTPAVHEDPPKTS
jgi:TatA/E family protein of Tat protein translocase